MRILGISAFYHDSAAALIEDGVELDLLVCGNCVLVKENQTDKAKTDYRELFDLD